MIKLGPRRQLWSLPSMQPMVSLQPMGSPDPMWLPKPWQDVKSFGGTEPWMCCVRDLLRTCMHQTAWGCLDMV